MWAKMHVPLCGLGLDLIMGRLWVLWVKLDVHLCGLGLDMVLGRLWVVWVKLDVPLCGVGLDVVMGRLWVVCVKLDVPLWGVGMDMVTGRLWVVCGVWTCTLKVGVFKVLFYTFLYHCKKLGNLFSSDQFWIRLMMTVKIMMTAKARVGGMLNTRKMCVWV